jgi:hypothetical protein
MRYVMMRLLLASRHEGTLLAGIPRVTRQAYIRQIFGTEIRSEHYGSSFVFEPFPSPTEDKIIGVIGKQDTVTVAGPPEQKFAHHDVSSWGTANILIDAAGGDDGQKVAMQGPLG